MLAVWQEHQDTAAFKIADQGGVAVIASPGEAIDAERITPSSRPTADDTQEDMATDGQHGALGKTHTGPTT